MTIFILFFHNSLFEAPLGLELTKITSKKKSYSSTTFQQYKKKKCAPISLKIVVWILLKLKMKKKIFNIQ
jgi:hypothetical protein